MCSFGIFQMTRKKCTQVCWNCHEVHTNVSGQICNIGALQEQSLLGCIILWEEWESSQKTFQSYRTSTFSLTFLLSYRNYYCHSWLVDCDHRDLLFGFLRIDRRLWCCSVFHQARIFKRHFIPRPRVSHRCHLLSRAAANGATTIIHQRGCIQFPCRKGSGLYHNLRWNKTKGVIFL